MLVIEQKAFTYTSGRPVELINMTASNGSLKESMVDGDVSSSFHTLDFNGAAGRGFIIDMVANRRVIGVTLRPCTKSDDQPRINHFSVHVLSTVENSKWELCLSVGDEVEAEYGQWRDFYCDQGSTIGRGTSDHPLYQTGRYVRFQLEHGSMLSHLCFWEFRVKAFTWTKCESWAITILSISFVQNLWFIIFIIKIVQVRPKLYVVDVPHHFKCPSRSYTLCWAIPRYFFRLATNQTNSSTVM